MKVKTAKNTSSAFKKKRAPKAAFFFLSLVGFCIVFADLLPLPFSPTALDLQHIYLPPLQTQDYIAGKPFHWLGTDHLGRDVLANIIYGCRTAILLSLPAMAIASALGLLLGGIAGFYGNKAIRLSITHVFTLLLTFVLAYYYGFYLPEYSFKESAVDATQPFYLKWLIFISILTTGLVVSKWLHKRILLPLNVSIPIDQLIMKCIEMLSSVPRIILILCLAAYTRPSLYNLILITGLTYWTEPARLIRAELLRVKTLNYIESARAMGLADFYILIRHALPNSLSSIIVAITFGTAGLISLESTLSFLNIGLPVDLPSWGRMVASIRNNFSAWWLVLFPGIALCSTVLSLQAVSNWLVYKLNPRNR
ncbi:ABC transporter permease [Rhodocytophaga aerolata]|uniref:ABC transporter permease n=1 Tax=Rhodocytophaga aerolata TaxID=455078 RepID=A0ABT8RHP8_9BACT|nr:ABC transporter permease [Rhodocytophaga aerolata]MDO1450325.1 ABC transporter permease [Rhodocytophaga aerolata]